MAKQTTEVTTNTPSRAMKKVSASQIKLADKPEGFEIEGKYVGTNEGSYIDKEGEEKKLFTMVIEDKTGNRIKFLADAGLRGALSDAMVVAGDWFKAVKGPKESIGRGRTMNSWDIFQYADEN